MENGIEAGLFHNFSHALVFTVKRNPARAGFVHDQQHAQAGRGDILEAAAIQLHGCDRLVRFRLFKERQQARRGDRKGDNLYSSRLSPLCLVGEVGFEPTQPRDNGFTVRLI